MKVSVFPNRRQGGRRGLTLMELVVVMTVLAALSAILIPMFPNLLRRAHKVTDATQSSEVAKAIQLYQGLYISYPGEWDLMTLATGTTAPTYLPTDGGNVYGAAAVIGNLTSDEVEALGRVGITKGHHFAATPGHPTMNPYAAIVTAPATLSATTPVFIIDPATTSGEVANEIKNIYLRDPTARFVLFGVGARSEMVGKVMQNAPTSVPQNKEFTPSTLYSRVGAIFQVAGVGITPGTTNTTKRARFVGTCALEDDELESTEKDLVGYYEISATGQ
jgi:prepilin-type N-terminal cleavage/methylation domain-containing protein